MVHVHNPTVPGGSARAPSTQAGSGCPGKATVSMVSMVSMNAMISVVGTGLWYRVSARGNNWVRSAPCLSVTLLRTVGAVIWLQPASLVMQV